MQLNVLNDLAEAMKALDGKKSVVKNDALPTEPRGHLAYPSMPRSAKGDCSMLVHIDDILIVGAGKIVLECSFLLCKQRTIEIMSVPVMR